MKQVLDLPLWIGHAGDGRDYRQLLDAGIQAIVQLAAEEPALSPPRDLLYLRFPLLDGEGNPPAILELTVRTAARLLAARIPTLMCCSAGMSRSPVIAAAALTLSGAAERDLDACLARLVRSHAADVSPALWNSVKEVCASVLHER
jgi:hypothetical protein